MAVKTCALNFNGYWRPPNVCGLPTDREFTLETEISRFKAKLGGYLKGLYL